MTRRCFANNGVLLGHRLRSQLALKFCAKALVKSVYGRPIALSCIVEYENNLTQMVIMTMARYYVLKKELSLFKAQNHSPLLIFVHNIQ